MRELFAENWISLSVLIALGLVLIFFRTSPSDLASIRELEDLIGAGQPVIVELYANS